MVRMPSPAQPTTLATGGTDVRVRGAGFSLVEILIVLALILLIGTLAVHNVTNLHRLRDERPVGDVLLDAVREARYQAAINKELCWLSYDLEKRAFHVSLDSRAPAPPVPEEQSVFGSSLIEEDEEDEVSQNASALKTFELFVPEDAESPKVGFFAVPPGTGFDGDPEDDSEDLKLTRVPFDPAGFSVPFQVQMDAPWEEYKATVIFDPFSNHILNAEDLE